MDYANSRSIGEEELAALIAKTDTAILDADDWEDAVAMAAIDCAILCNSLALSGGGEFNGS